MSPALLFDLDGTLLHSDAIHEQVFRELLAARGIDMPEGFYAARIHGRLNVDIFAELLPDEPDPQGLSEWKEAQFRARLPRPYPAMPGAAALIERAAAEGWALAVVTNAMRPNAEAMLAAIDLASHMQTIVIGEECPRGKPAPDPYLAAMAALDVAPEHCIAFEDSPSGVASAAAAGARVIGIRSSLDAAALLAAGAETSISDFNDPALEPLLARHQGAFQ